MPLQFRRLSIPQRCTREWSTIRLQHTAHNLQRERTSCTLLSAKQSCERNKAAQHVQHAAPRSDHSANPTRFHAAPQGCAVRDKHTSWHVGCCCDASFASVPRSRARNSERVTPTSAVTDRRVRANSLRACDLRARLPIGSCQ